MLARIRWHSTRFSVRCSQSSRDGRKGFVGGAEAGSESVTGRSHLGQVTSCPAISATSRRAAPQCGQAIPGVVIAVSPFRLFLSSACLSRPRVWRSSVCPLESTVHNVAPPIYGTLAPAGKGPSNVPPVWLRAVRPVRVPGLALLRRAPICKIHYDGNF